MGGLFSDSEKNKIPKYLENASKNLLDRSNKQMLKDFKKGYKPYKGDAVAGWTPQHSAAKSAVNKQRNLASGLFDDAMDNLRGVNHGTDLYSTTMGALKSGNTQANKYLNTGDDYLGDAGSAYDRMKLGIDAAGKNLNAQRDVLGDSRSTANAMSKAINSMGSSLAGANKLIDRAANRGSTTSSAIGDYSRIPGIVEDAQGRAEDMQIGGNAGLKSALQGNLDTTDYGYDSAQGYTDRAADLTGDNYSAISARMSPYADAVMDKSLRDFDRVRTQGALKLDDSARAAGAFGGSRHGVAQGLYDRQTSEGVSDIITDSNQANYDRAIAQLNADRSGLMGAGAQTSGIQSARDSGAIGLTGALSGMNAADAALLRQGGLDLAGATKDSAAGKMAGERQLFDFDTGAAKLRQDQAAGYGNQGDLMRSKSDALRDIASGYGDAAQGELSRAEMTRSQGDAYSDLAGRYSDYAGAKGAQASRFASDMLGLQSQRFNEDLAYSDALTKMGQADQASRQAYAADLLGLGKEFRNIAQEQKDFDYNEWEKARNYRYELLNHQLGMLSGQPYAQSTTTQKGPGNAIIGAIGTALGGFVSDEDKKENRSAADLEGLLASFRDMPIDDYTYKPEVVEEMGVPAGPRTGPMAQDWAAEFGGDGKTIDVAQMLGKMAGAIKALEARTAPVEEEKPTRGLPPRKRAA